jgi:DNA replication and repair protein RecF
MLLSKIHLNHFRNFGKVDFNFGPFLTLIIGENAHGKTSLLESIYSSVHGCGYRESREMELITWDHDQALIESIFIEKDLQTRFQIRLLKQASERVEKQFYVNKTKKSWYQYKDLQTKAVLFAPEHIALVSGSPSRRREYFNTVISEFDREYRKRLRNYETALRKRNKVYELYTNEDQLDMELPFWNNYLLENAAYITHAREKYMTYLNTHPNVDGKEFVIEYLKDEFSEERMRDVFAQEKRMRKTVIGPQKDEFIISLKNGREKNVQFYGSRSEQRLAVFWLKLNEINYFESILKKKPILLLDDVFSELDAHNKELVMRVVKQYQTVITTTEEESKDLAEVPEVIIRL